MPFYATSIYLNHCLLCDSCITSIMQSPEKTLMINNPSSHSIHCIFQGNIMFSQIFTDFKNFTEKFVEFCFLLI